ncbi:hypothetical protein BCR39DRAFT_555855 [Naematelia encephala]|uniref:Uncharacterized protein n=1 Tax=Naematelia encephala TaxID=71784 RepID=A0A1Y2BLS3_9TREE|nr:hypothetical protein BCR39DRAFT_555855 [Naematelia encephala]
MFWKKRSSSTEAPLPRPVFPSEAPRPILKPKPQAGISAPGPSIRFAGSGYQNKTTASPRAPEVIITNYDQPSRPHTFHEPTPLPMASRSPSPSMRSRRSSRPVSPASSSFGSRTHSMIVLGSGSSSNNQSPLTAGTPPMASHVTTPPMAYVSSMQTRAPPPPSPYRPTHERTRSVTRTSVFPEQLPMTGEMAPRPPRHSSLFPCSDSLRTLAGTGPDASVPMLNIIPATPQDNSEEFRGAWVAPPRKKRLSLSLGAAVKLDEGEMVDIPLEQSEPLPAPTPKAEPLSLIDVNLDFSPFQPIMSLPSSTSANSIESSAPVDALPPSPPFQSYPSLPSLESSQTMPSSDSQDSVAYSMPTSSSESSLVSFPDVEEALGSMLASLSDSHMPSFEFGDNGADKHEEEEKSVTPRMRYGLGMLSDHEKETSRSRALPENLGLGLGLDFDMAVKPHTTAPLSPRRRPVPPPLDMTLARAVSTSTSAPQSAPLYRHFGPTANIYAPVPSSASTLHYSRSSAHRVAFYGTARAHPNSPTSGVFTLTSGSGSTSSLSDAPTERASMYGGSSTSSEGGCGGGPRDRDSISLASEASDDDLHTASIINLTPVIGGKEAVMMELKEEMAEPDQVGVAL